jgi:hypothetical protein
MKLKWLRVPVGGFLIEVVLAVVLLDGMASPRQRAVHA